MAKSLFFKNEGNVKKSFNSENGYVRMVKYWRSSLTEIIAITINFNWRKKQWNIIWFAMLSGRCYCIKKTVGRGRTPPSLETNTYIPLNKKIKFSKLFRRDSPKHCIRRGNAEKMKRFAFVKFAIELFLYGLWANLG